jgi:transposase
VNIFERSIRGRKYRIASQSVWDPVQARSVARQAILGSAEPLTGADLVSARVAGQRAIGDVGALVWVAEQLGLIGLVDEVCGPLRSRGQPSLGEMVLAVAVQRACEPGPKCELASFLASCLPRVSCLPEAKFTGLAFHRLAKKVTDEQLERVQIALARRIVERFSLRTDVLAFDTTNFDTHIATTTPGELARRGHAKSKRKDLRVVGLGLLVSETEHVPLLYRCFPGNSSDQAVLRDCLHGLHHLQDALDRTSPGKPVSSRLLVRDGGFWSPDMEVVLDVVGYGSLIALPMGHKAAEEALAHAATRGAMVALKAPGLQVRAARLRTLVGKLDRTLIVVESQELLEGQKRGVAARLEIAKQELRTLQRQAAAGKMTRPRVVERLRAILAREHLHAFVDTRVSGTESVPTVEFSVNAAKRRELERKRLGRRVLCTDQHAWSTERVVRAFRGQWKVEELFRRAKKGAVAPWGPSHQWADSSLRLHTFCTVVGLTLVSLARVAVAPNESALAMMESLREVKATQVRLRGGTSGRPATVLVAPELTAEQSRMVEVFELGRWLPALVSSRREVRRNLVKKAAALAFVTHDLQR